MIQWATLIERGSFNPNFHEKILHSIFCQFFITQIFKRKSIHLLRISVIKNGKS